MKKTLTMKKTLITLGTVALSSSAYAAISYTGSTLTEDFTGYTGLLAPTAWDADGFSSGAGFSELRGASTGGETTGGTYAFDIGSGNVALGVQPGGSDFTPGFYQLEVTNDSGATVSNWAIAFESYQLNNTDRGNSFDFSYSTDGLAFTPVASGSFTSDAAALAAPVWESGVSYSENIAVTVANGGSLFLRWSGDDDSGAGSRDEFALDDVVIGAAAPVPEPSSTALLGLGGLALILRRRR